MNPKCFFSLTSNEATELVDFAVEEDEDGTRLLRHRPLCGCQITRWPHSSLKRDETAIGDVYESGRMYRPTQRTDGRSDVVSRAIQVEILFPPPPPPLRCMPLARPVTISPTARPSLPSPSASGRRSGSSSRTERRPVAPLLVLSHELFLH